MNPVPKILIGSGIFLICLGLLWQFGGKFLHLGKLPGDIAIERENFRFYFPVVTSILLSALFSILIYFINYLSKK
jgi:hypothetical protein